MRYFVGAYASSPNTSGWDPELEKDYYNQVKTIPNLRGLEHPFLGKLHAHDDDWFLENIDPNWDFVITCIPGVMAAIGQNPAWGIASDDENGRQQALSFLEDASKAVAKLNARTGKQSVTAVQIHTAPNQGKAKSSVAALEQSLETILSWDWQGAQIVIEHCDAYVEGQQPSKGFLSLDDEITAVKNVNAKLNSNVGFVINWGRSVIETRTTEGALNHIQQAKENGLLSGLMFSGVSDQETAFGAWKDTHMPQASNQHGVAGSLMTETEMHKCLAAAQAESLPIVGVKLGIRPREATIADRIEYNKEAIAILDRFAG